MKQDKYINSVNLNKNTNFPYLVLDVKNGNSYPRNPGFQVMHWHEDLQFIYVLEGEIELVTLEGHIFVQAGEAVYINKNVVHLVKQSAVCHHKSFVFPEYFLKFYYGSPAEASVDQIVENKAFPIYHIADCEENQNVLSVLQKMSALKKDETEFYFYEVLSTLSMLWLEFLRIVQMPEGQKDMVNNQTKERMATFLQYIEQYYGEEISLEMLAKSANVSKSECLRCFKTALGTTPYKYLIEYRLSKAAELLCNTDELIENIAVQVGFQHVSHFGKCFREKTGLSPGAYRRRK